MCRMSTWVLSFLLAANEHALNLQSDLDEYYASIHRHKGQT
uniref:Uncharacterized protein n=1 Tax=Arundo donax TaxID=35708 RepID=A0A0A9AIB3_ARUDO